MNVIAFCNQKGGVGKTTTALNVGAALARKGKSVLLVDLDAQGSLTTSAGVNVADNDVTIYEVLKGLADVNEAIRHRGAYDILPADIRFSAAELELSNVPGREKLLQEAIEELKTPYDVIIIDCSPSLSVITLMGLTACNSVIIPVQAHFLPLNGMAALLDTIQLVKKRMNPRITIGGVVLTMYDNRRVLAREVKENIAQAYPNALFNTAISSSTVLAEAPAAGKDIYEYKPDSKGAQQYEALTDEIIKRLSEV